MRAFKDCNVKVDVALACLDNRWSLRGSVERATDGPMVLMYSLIRFRVFRVVNRKVNSSSMRHCEQVRMRMSSGRLTRERAASVCRCAALRRGNDGIANLGDKSSWRNRNDARRNYGGSVAREWAWYEAEASMFSSDGSMTPREL